MGLYLFICVGLLNFHCYNPVFDWHVQVQQRRDRCIDQSVVGRFYVYVGLYLFMYMGLLNLAMYNLVYDGRSQVRQRIDRYIDMENR